jgi:hypothetical protein
MVKEILQFLKKNPKILDDNFSSPRMRIVFSNTRKKTSEFHRLIVENYTHGTSINQIFWIKVLKNKSLYAMQRSLKKQYHYMQDIWNTFQNKNHQSVILSSCQPIALLSNFNALITKECSGRLFNTYLMTSIPLLHEKSILSHCYNLGMWLGTFHEHHKVNNEISPNMDCYTSKQQNDSYKNSFVNWPYITYCHRDYTPRNVFIGQDMVEVIDFVDVKKGLADEDISYFIKYVTHARFNFMYRNTFKKRMINHFLSGYERQIVLGSK